MTVHVFVPGLRTAWPKEAASEPLDAAYLNQFFRTAVSQRLGASHWIDVFASLLTQQSPDKNSYAVWFAAKDDIHVPQGAQLFLATPVFLQADRDQVFMPASDLVNPSKQEIEALTHQFSRYYTDAPFRLVSNDDKSRLYLICESPFDVNTVPLFSAEHKYISPSLPKGRHASELHHLINEMQMMCHGMTMNIERESTGLLPINCLWLWGENSLIPFNHRVHWCQTDHALTEALAEVAEVEIIALNQPMPKTGQGVVICNDVFESATNGAWFDWVDAINHKISPLFEQLAPRFNELVVYDGAGYAYRQGGGWLRRRLTRRGGFLNIASS